MNEADEAKKYLLGKEVLASGRIMAIETSFPLNCQNNYEISIHVRWNVNEKQYEKLMQKVKTTNLNVSLIDGDF